MTETTKGTTDTNSCTVDTEKTSTNSFVLLLSYHPPLNIVNIRLAVITLLAIVLPLHNHWKLFGSREISLITAFLGLEGQYILAAYSLGWLVACTGTSQQLNDTGMITMLASLLHLPTTLIAIVYCIGRLVIQVVTDFFWYLFIAICTISLDILVF